MTPTKEISNMSKRDRLKTLLKEVEGKEPSDFMIDFSLNYMQGATGQTQDVIIDKLINALEKRKEQKNEKFVEGV